MKLLFNIELTFSYIILLFVTNDRTMLGIAFDFLQNSFIELIKLYDLER